MSGNWADVTPRVTPTHHMAQSINHKDQNTKEEVETMNKKLENKQFVLQKALTCKFTSANSGISHSLSQSHHTKLQMIIEPQYSCHAWQHCLAVPCSLSHLVALSGTVPCSLSLSSTSLPLSNPVLYIEFRVCYITLQSTTRKSCLVIEILIMFCSKSYISQNFILKLVMKSNKIFYFVLYYSKYCSNEMENNVIIVAAGDASHCRWHWH